MNRELAEKILKEVPFENRFIAARMVMPSGMRRVAIRSLEEMYWFLSPARRSLPGINLESMADWVEHHIGDTQTASDIRLLVCECSSQIEACKQVWTLLGERVDQAREVRHDLV